MLKVGLIGVGGISGAHIPAWDAMEDVQLVALCDVRPEQLKAYTHTKHCYTDMKEMLDNEELDILDICLPTYLHAEVSIAAMNRGIHVICEKPISLKEEDVKRVYAAAQQNNVCFMVAQVLRFWQEYEVLKEIYDKGTYGKLLSGAMYRLGTCPRWSWDGWMKDENRSGLVPFDLHIHDLDFMVYAFGEPQRVVKSRARRPEQDFMIATYHYKDFFIHAEASWYAGNYPFQCSFRFQFEEAVVEWKDGKLMAYPTEGDPVALMGQAETADGVINLSDLGPYAREIRYFTDCVKAGVPADRVKPAELETVLRLIHQESV